MATILEKYIKDKASYAIPEGGLAFWIVPNNQVDWMQISKKLKSQGIKIITPDTYSFDQTVNGIRLGYGSLSEQELENGIIALSKLL
jgi:GntR family transcriptional regulator/MocR family aminotransferase